MRGLGAGVWEVAMAAGRVCPKPNCPVILTRGERYCPTHLAQYEARRGTSAQRGYGAKHQALRRSWQARVDRGELIRCATCGAPITGTQWHLGHTPDRTAYRGPECISCNTSEGGTRGAREANRRAQS